jgi:hypothetical protein
MEKKSKILLFVFFTAILVSVGFTYYKIFILKDYIIKLEAGCDPTKEKCFIRECDPETDEECPANLDERISYYKIIEKKASAIPVCESGNDHCPEINCAGDADCREILCDENTAIEGEICNNPETYIKQSEAKNTENTCGINNENCPIEKSVSPEMPDNTTL